MCGNGDAHDEAPIAIPIEDTLDLHAFAPRDIPSVVDEYLRAAHARGLRLVRLIHGRGKGVQRAVVHRLLATHPLVRGWSDSPESRLGATAVTLVDALAPHVPPFDTPGK